MENNNDHQSLHQIDPGPEYERQDSIYACGACLVFVVGGVAGLVVGVIAGLIIAVGS